jgi:hypothetical protein
MRRTFAYSDTRKCASFLFLMRRTADASAACATRVRAPLLWYLLSSHGNRFYFPISLEIRMPVRLYPDFLCHAGIYEALELRDKDPKKYLGKGVLKVTVPLLCCLCVCVCVCVCVRARARG